MQKVELNYLINQKRKEGKSSREILNEISQLIISQEGFKDLKQSNKILEKKLERKEKEIDKLEEKIRKKDKELFNIKLKKDSMVEEQKTRCKGVPTANVHQLKRILCLLESIEKPLTKNKIRIECGMSPQQTNSALNFLVNKDLINVKKGLYLK